MSFIASANEKRNLSRSRFNLIFQSSAIFLAAQTRELSQVIIVRRTITDDVRDVTQRNSSRI
jgi:hypothetical protein